MDELNTTVPTAAENPVAVSVSPDEGTRETPEVKESETAKASDTGKAELDLDSLLSQDEHKRKAWEKLKSDPLIEEDIKQRLKSERESDRQKWQTERDAEIRAKQQAEWEEAILNTPDDDLDKLVELGKFTKSQVATIRAARSKEETLTQQAHYIASSYYKTMRQQDLDFIPKERWAEVKEFDENGNILPLKQQKEQIYKIYREEEVKKAIAALEKEMEERITQKVIAAQREEDETPLAARGGVSTDDETFIRQYGEGKSNDHARYRKLFPR